MLTLNQATHREFIQSPLWKEIRAKAFEFHGHNCASCGNTASDIHHKTYERFGGRELMTDLEPLCRNCHEAKHAVERAGRTRRRKRRPCLRAVAAYRYLTASQKRILMEKFRIVSETELFCVFRKHRGLMLEARRMLSVNILELGKPNVSRRAHGKPYHQENAEIDALLMPKLHQPGTKVISLPA